MIEAIALALNSRIGGRGVLEELNPYWFNTEMVEEFVALRKAGKKVALPEILIELYLDERDDLQGLCGAINTDVPTNACPGISLRIFPNEEYRDMLDEWLKSPTALLPVEYYTYEWRSFAAFAARMNMVDSNREVEQFSELWTLAGRPSLIDPAERCSDLLFKGEKAGLDTKQLMLGLALAESLGSPTPGYQDLNRLIIYHQLSRRAAAFKQHPSDDAWMPENTFSASVEAEKKREFCRSQMKRFAPLIDGMYRDLYEDVDRKFPGYLQGRGEPIRHPGLEFALKCSVFSIVQRFRDAVEHVISVHGAPMHIRDFPRGCCGITSELLGDYLNTLEMGEFQYVSSARDGASHAWLEVDGLVVDITSDQFAERPRIYVDRSDTWYQSWEQLSRNKAVYCSSAPTYGDESRFMDKVLAMMSEA